MTSQFTTKENPVVKNRPSNPLGTSFMFLKEEAQKLDPSFILLVLLFASRELRELMHKMTLDLEYQITNELWHREDHQIRKLDLEVFYPTFILPLNQMKKEKKLQCMLTSGAVLIWLLPSFAFGFLTLYIEHGDERTSLPFSMIPIPVEKRSSTLIRGGEANHL